MQDLQHRVDATIARQGGYWPVEKILNRMAEEVGELCRAHRKLTPREQRHELGDVVFTAICLANKTGVNLGLEVLAAIERAKNKEEQPPDGQAMV